MSIKSVYLSSKRLRELRDSLEYNLEEGSTNLYLKLRDYIWSSDRYYEGKEKGFEGEFLINIFDDKELRLLRNIDNNYKLFDDVDTILKAIQI